MTNVTAAVPFERVLGRVDEPFVPFVVREVLTVSALRSPTVNVAVPLMSVVTTALVPPELIFGVDAPTGVPRTYTFLAPGTGFPLASTTCRESVAVAFPVTTVEEVGEAST